MHKFFFKIFLSIVFVSTFVSISYAQQPFYRMELGAWAGADFETSTTLYKNLRPAFGALLRYKFDKRWALRFDGGIYNIHSNFIDLETQNQISHTNLLITGDMMFEFNFFDFEINQFNRKARRFTPYIFAGIGATTYEFEKQREFQPLVPFGLGFKYKIAPRWNFNIQYIHHLSFTDRLEGVDPLSDMYEIKGSNFLNKDMISAITVSITFDFWRFTGRCFCE